MPIRSIVFKSILVLTLLSPLSLRAEVDAHTAQPGGAQKSTAPVSENMQTILDRIARMESITNGKTPPVPKKTEDDPEPFLRPRTVLVDEAVRELLAGLDNGKLTSALERLLIDNESYTNVEHEEVFVVDGVDLYEKLTDDEKKAAAVAYTEARKKLRLALFNDVIKKLEASADPRALLVADAVRDATVESQRSYDLALQNIKNNNLLRPICFTCGEPVAEDPKSDDEEFYEFYEAMGNAAEKAVKIARLDVTDDNGVVRRPVFDPERKAFTFDGTTLYDRGGSAHQITKDKSGSLLYAKEDGKPGYLNASDRTQKALMDLRTQYINNPNKNTPPAAQPSNGGGLAAMPSAKVTPQVAAYLAATKEAGKSPLSLYPTADKMGKALGLVTAAGESVLIHKNNHIQKLTYAGPNGVPFEQVSPEYGVHINWAAIESAPAEKRRLMMETLKSVRDGDIHDYKIVNGNSGYCLWCNLRNDPVSVQKLREYFGQ